MGFLDWVEKESFETFRAEVEQRLQKLSEEINHKVSDSEDIAKKAAESSVAHEQKSKNITNSIEATLKQLEQFNSEAQKIKESMEKDQNDLTSNNLSLKEKIKSTEELYLQALEIKKTIDSSANEISEKTKEIEEILDECSELPASLEKTQSLLADSEKYNASINDLLTHSMKKKSEIDDLHKTIYGTDIKNEEGQIEHIDGLKDALDRSYNELEARAKKLDETTKTSIDEITENHSKTLANQTETFKNFVNESKARFEEVNKQIKSLLPGSMAAGLSAAYESKTQEEISSLRRFEKFFTNSLLGLVGVSLIPFSVDVYLLGWKGADLVGVIKDTPSLIISILPLYFPVLWLAYSSNKKINLSKRLIEEYTHKAVLGKTFSGLANQIDTLPHESTVKEELRTRLLFNVLQVSAENPGKLITDYNKSDHPLMEALENSAKLSDSVEALSKLPGFGAIARKLSEKTDELLKSQGEKVERGLSTQDSLKPDPQKHENTNPE